MSKRMFLKICETVITRTHRDGFLIGDTVKVTNFNGLRDDIKNALKDEVDKGLNMKVIDIINKYPSAAPGSTQNSSGEVTLVIACDYGGGRRVGEFLVPPSCCEIIDNYPNLDPVPDALMRHNIITIKPEPVPGYEDEEFTFQSDKADTGKGLKKVDRKLGDKNTPQPGPEPYTKNYLPS